MQNNIGNTVEPAALFEVAPHQSELRRVVRVFFGRKLAVVGLVLVVLLIITAISAPWIVPYPPNDIDMTNTLAKPSAEHWLGTDNLGRDILSRIIYGARTSIIIAVGATAVSVIIGEVLGLIAAHFGGIVFQIIMRFIDALMAVPMLLIALIMATLLGGGPRNVILALGVGMVSVHARMMCAQALSVKQNDYILAARAMGMKDLRMMFQEIVPNAFPALVVVATVGLGAVILAEAGLSFLGVGVMPPNPAWGGMISEGYKYILSNPAMALSPGVAIMLVVFGFNMMGDGLRDALDPRLRGVV
ncbi:MAG: ABC transporter permease [Dehalococcoidales bacterium]|jgi:peptide/nickel transport system permease protein|nr:ABC transporter permease [Dehalococcoidales bacterium]